MFSLVHFLPLSSVTLRSWPSVKGKAKPGLPSQALTIFSCYPMIPIRADIPVPFVGCVREFLSTGPTKGPSDTRILHTCRPDFHIFHLFTLPLIMVTCCYSSAVYSGLPLRPANSSLGPNPFSVTGTCLRLYSAKPCTWKSRSFSLLHVPLTFTIAVCSSQPL